MLVKTMSRERSLGRYNAAGSGLKLGKNQCVSKTTLPVLFSTQVMTINGYGLAGSTVEPRLSGLFSLVPIFHDY